MKRQRKAYQGPKHPWQAVRIKEEADLVFKYGLKNKKEIWRAVSKVRNWRAQARNIIALPKEDQEHTKKILFEKLNKLGLMKKGADIDDVLGLTLEALLHRRLQTILLEQKLAKTIRHARQLVAHKKVMVNDKIISSPSYSVRNEDKISLVK